MVTRNRRKGGSEYGEWKTSVLDQGVATASEGISVKKMMADVRRYVVTMERGGVNKEGHGGVWGNLKSPIWRALPYKLEKRGWKPGVCATPQGGQCAQARLKSPIRQAANEGGESNQ